MSKKVIIYRGVPGSGKSTHQRKNYPDAVVCSADDYFEELAVKNNTSYREEFDFKLLKSAHIDCQAKFVFALRLMGADTIVVDNTNIELEDFKVYKLLAELEHYEVEIITMPMTEPAFVYAERNTHGVPENSIQRMLDNFEE